MGAGSVMDRAVSSDSGEDDRIVLNLLNSVDDGAQSQRRIAEDLGIALGLVNAYLKRCVKKGLVKVSQAPARRYAYYLTPQGFAEKSRLTGLRDRLWAGLADLGGTYLNGAESPRAPSILNVSFEGIEGESLVTGLAGLAVSTGSACNSASGDPSYVLRALGRDTQLAQSSLRFSVGRFTTPQDIDFAVQAVRREVTRLRALSPYPRILAPHRNHRPLHPLFDDNRYLPDAGESGGPGHRQCLRRNPLRRPACRIDSRRY